MKDLDLVMFEGALWGLLVGLKPKKIEPTHPEKE